MVHLLGGDLGGEYFHYPWNVAACCFDCAIVLRAWVFQELLKRGLGLARNYSYWK